MAREVSLNLGKKNQGKHLVKIIKKKYGRESNGSERFLWFTPKSS